MTDRCQYHCGACGQHFTSLRAFDTHRTGDHQARAGSPEGRRRLDAVDDERFLCVTTSAFCDMRAVRLVPVCVYSLRADDGRARRAFSRAPKGLARDAGADPALPTAPEVASVPDAGRSA